MGNGTDLSGGKLIGFDLAKAESGAAGALTEGSLLAGNPGWLRRVFANSEISRINTFSDEALANFDVQKVGAPNQVAQAASILELARRVQAYATVGSDSRGVQIVSEPSWFGGGEKAQTFLRLVKTDQADAEKDAVLGEMPLAGAYVSHLVDRGDGSLWIETSAQTVVSQNPYQTETTYRVYRLRLDGSSGLAIAQQAQWKEQGVYRWRPMPMEMAMAAMPPRARTVELAFSEARSTRDRRSSRDHRPEPSPAERRECRGIRCGCAAGLRDPEEHPAFDPGKGHGTFRLLLRGGPGSEEGQGELCPRLRGSADPYGKHGELRPDQTSRGTSLRIQGGKAELVEDRKIANTYARAFAIAPDTLGYFDSGRLTRIGFDDQYRFTTEVFYLEGLADQQNASMVEVLDDPSVAGGKIGS